MRRIYICGNKSKKGSSLIEILIAIFVLGVALMSIIASMLIVTQGAGGQKDGERARQFALDVMEECESLRFIPAAGGAFSKSDYEAAIAGMRRDVVRGGKVVLSAKPEVIGWGGDAGAFLPGQGPVSADLRIVVAYSSAQRENNIIELTREVSVSGWQNVGDKSL